MTIKSLITLAFLTSTSAAVAESFCADKTSMQHFMTQVLDLKEIFTGQTKKNNTMSLFVSSNGGAWIVTIEKEQLIENKKEIITCVVQSGITHTNPGTAL